MENKLIWLVVLFCLGVILANCIRISPELALLLSTICLIFSLVAFKIKRFPNVFLVCSIILLGALHYKSTAYLPKTHISNFLYYKNQTVYAVTGYIKNEPRYKDNCWEFIFVTSQLQFNQKEYKCCGDILVKLKCANALSYGEEMILIGKIQRPTEFSPDCISGVMHIRSPQLVISLHKNKGFFMKRVALSLKTKIEKIIYSQLSPLSAAVLDAMVLGEKDNIPRVIYDAMIKSGTVHILVVSGFNVGVVAFIIMLFFKILRIPGTMRYLLAIFFLVIYCFATGASAPVMRATLMGIFFLIGFLAKREPQVHNSISLAALIILLINPQELFSISFQLSFASVLAIIIFYPRIELLVRLEAIQSKFLKAIAQGCCVSLSAWLGTLGLILCYFRIFSPVTILANIVIVPVATLITLSGFSLLLASLVFPPSAVYFAYANELLVVFLLKINSFFIQLPGAYLYL